MNILYFALLWLVISTPGVNLNTKKPSAAKPMGSLRLGNPENQMQLKSGNDWQLEPHVMCEAEELFDKKTWWKVHNCKFESGATLDDVMNYFGQEQYDETMCGALGYWIHDRDGNLIGAFKNPPCPRRGKSRGNSGKKSPKETGKTKRPITRLPQGVGVPDSLRRAIV